MTLFVQREEEARYFKDFTEWGQKFVFVIVVQQAAKSTLLVKDIRDELRLLLQVFEDQMKVIEKFAEEFWPSKSPGMSKEAKDSARSLAETFINDSGLESLTRRVKQMDQDASTILEGVSYTSSAIVHSKT